MITLKTLPQATAQEVFDQVATHLLTQYRRTQRYENSSYGCAYRGPTGDRCAAGCLIAEDEYRPRWESHSWLHLVDEGYVPSNHASLINQLQGVHDIWKPNEWKEQLARVAGRRDLNPSVLDNFPHA